MCKIRHLKLSSGCWSILVLGKDKAVGALDLNFKDEGIGGAFYLDGGGCGRSWGCFRNG